ncbi:phosphatase [Streptomyces sp. AJS327]|uniref:ATP-binding SpoIIE family protein phosphatase n=1 Tax=Streptomyces sp. AJS327 TaxID=2545265 RepID=UPI0015DDC0F8|nr:SpoIIE family protein phosphatase [Streptomyces sp. AJS327]MBA0052958.1 phosphatase [Streptomyces sp. AJS327]
MHIEDVLTAVGVGVWRWENADQTVIVDAYAARLIGVEPDPEGGSLTLSEPSVRARINPVDFVEYQGAVTLAVAEGTLAEGQVRIVDDDGRLLRTVRLRMAPQIEEHATRLIGLIAEIPGPPSAAGEPEPAEQETRNAPAVTGDWRRHREAFLLDAGRALAEAQSTAEVLRVAASLAMPGFTPSALAVFALEGDRLRVIGHHGQTDSETDERPFLDMPLSTDYPGAEVVRTGRAIYLSSPGQYQRRFPTSWPLAEPYGRQSWAFLPLAVAGRSLGAWMAAFDHRVAFTPDERSVLTTVARMLGQALSRTALNETERELSAGLQRTMRPVRQPRITGMNVAGRYIPTGGGLQVGGDWYDVIPLPSGRTALVIGDVQGHDIRAAGVMAQLRVALRAYAAEGHHPEAVLARTSRFLHGMTPGGSTESADTTAPAESVPHGDSPRFATCLYAEVDATAGTLIVARAGHPDPVIRMADGSVLTRPTAGGLPLGIEPDPEYPTTRLVLEPGETLLIFTDGLIETGGHDWETGWERLRGVLTEQGRLREERSVVVEGPNQRAPRGEGLEWLADSLVREVQGPTSHYARGPLGDRREDDIALLLLEHGPESARGAAAEAGSARRTVLTVAQAQSDRVSDARNQLHSLLYDWADPDQLDGAVLMLSEMLTNVLIHTDSDALMVAEVSGESGSRLLRVTVSDHSDELPHRRRPGELASSGRGLVLLEMLAGNWGVDPQGEGKRIWFELREGEGTPAAAAPPGLEIEAIE